jgi:hypothetical protein
LKNGRCAAGVFGLGQENKIKKAPQGLQDSSWSLPIGTFRKLLLKMTPRRLKIDWEVFYKRGIVYSSSGFSACQSVQFVTLYHQRIFYLAGTVLSSKHSLGAMKEIWEFVHITA